MIRTPVVLALLFPLALSAQLVSPNLELGPERPVAEPGGVPSWSQLDAIVPDHNGFIVFWSKLSAGPHGAIEAALMARRVDNAGRQVTPDVEVMPETNRWPVSVSRRNDGSLLLAWGTLEGVFMADAGADLVLRGDPIRLSAGFNPQPATACNATACAVIWADSSSRSATILGPDGTSTTIALPGSGSTYKVAAAGNGSTFAVAYQSVDTGFVVFDSEGKILTNEVYAQVDAYSAAVASTANSYVMALPTKTGVRLTNKDAQGATIATRDVALPFTAADVAVTATGGEPLLIVSQAVWQGIIIEGSVPKIRLYAVNGALLPIDEPLHTDVAVQAVFNGTAILTGWTSAGFGFGPVAGFYRRFDRASPDAHEPTPVASRPAGQRAAALARTDAAELVVWTEDRLDGYDIEAAVRPAGSDALAQPIPLEPMSLFEFGAAAATDGHDFAVVWTWADFNGQGVRAALIDASGAVTHRIEVDGLRMSNVTWFDGHYVFVTNSNSTVRLNRLARDGTITSVDIGTTTHGLRVALAALDDRLGVLLAPDPNILFRTVDRDGGTIAERQLAPLRATYAALASHERQFLAAIRTYDTGRLLTYRFGSDGTVLDAVPVELDDGLPMAIPPIVVESRGGFLVAWQRSDGSSRGVVVSTPTGLVGTPFPLAPSDSPASAIAAAPNGSITMLSTKATRVPPDSRIVTRDLFWRSQPKRRSVR